MNYDTKEKSFKIVSLISWNGLGYATIFFRNEIIDL